MWKNLEFLCAVRVGQKPHDTQIGIGLICDWGPQVTATCGEGERITSCGCHSAFSHCDHWSRNATNRTCSYDALFGIDDRPGETKEIRGETIRAPVRAAPRSRRSCISLSPTPLVACKAAPWARRRR